MGVAMRLVVATVRRRSVQIFAVIGLFAVAVEALDSDLVVSSNVDGQLAESELSLLLAERDAEIGKLRAENSKLQAENNKLRAELTKLPSNAVSDLELLTAASVDSNSASVAETVGLGDAGD